MDALTTWMLERRGRDTGSGLVGASAGIVVLVTVLVALAQLSLNLTTTSAITAAGYHAARTVAAATVDHDDAASVASSIERAEQDLRASVGRSGPTMELAWDIGPDTVHLTVSAEVPRIVPDVATRPMGLDQVRRTFVVRIEQVR